MQAGISEMRAEIGNARGAAEMWKREGKFRVKEKDKDKKGERKNLRKDLKKEREGKVASNENMRRRKKYLQEGTKRERRREAEFRFVGVEFGEFCSSGSRLEARKMKGEL